jgi:hypothetical protein
MPLKAEAAEQHLLHQPRFAHHRLNLLHPTEENQRPAPRSSRAFQRHLRIPPGWNQREAAIAGRGSWENRPFD